MTTTIEVVPVLIADDQQRRSVVTFRSAGGSAKVIVTFPLAQRAAAVRAFNARRVTITVACDDEARAPSPATETPAPASPVKSAPSGSVHVDDGQGFRVPHGDGG